ncbi:MAG TPA: polymorphic toxin-type HINT domain-containing protein, partial [Vicinamibacterales bacterium]|nr:polymorphic toxin-type HINT domain-containing protein [Vicinamibacterales bacterium]
MNSPDPHDPLEAVIDYDCSIPNVNGRPLFVLPALSPDPNEDQQLRATLTTLHQRGRAARHLAEYARYTLDVVPALHHTLICEAIDALLDDQFDTLVVNTPPGAAKSTYTSHALCAYFMGRFPRSNIILATHTADLSEKWSRKVRNTLADPLHQHVFPESELSRDSTAVGRWATSLGGEFLAAGVGASILGFRADLCLTGNTLLRTPDGHKFISAITKGDRVLAYDPVTSTTSYQRVVATVERQTTGRIYRIHTADRRVVEATGNHPFYSAGEYISAEALTVGLPLLSAVAVPHTLATFVTRIEILDPPSGQSDPDHPSPPSVTVYDIQVENTANFFANGILVHNCVIDDPISGFEQAQSMTQLAKVHGWYENDLMTRMKPRAKTVLICQRLARNDLAGYMMDRNAGNPHIRQRTLIFRMEAQPGDPPDGTGRSPGERLWPEWYSQEMVEDNKLDDFKWRTLYQQEPPS